ncbi:MAG TPA: CGNR zinc finger domain-containing protein [Mycobacteriales bacterium]
MVGSGSAAPGRLETVRRLVNTRDIEAGTDALAGPEDLRDLLHEAALLAPDADADHTDLAHALALREGLRAALAANQSGQPVSDDAVAVLNEAAGRAGMSLSFGTDAGWAVQPRAAGVDGALGGLLVIVVEAMTDGTWSRLKVCQNDTCRWAYYDHSRGRSGRWCSMQLCGNRAKQRGWRERQPGPPERTVNS